MENSKKAIQIIETAKRLFAEKGFKAVTTREIAKEAGVNEVTIFRHFENKGKLFEQIIRHSTSSPKISEYINQEEPDLEKYLKGIARLIQFVFTENIEIFKIELFERKMLADKKQISVMPNKIKEFMSKYMVSIHGLNEKEADCFSITYMSAIHGLCMNMYFIKSFDSMPSFNDCVDLIVSKYK